MISPLPTHRLAANFQRRDRASSDVRQELRRAPLLLGWVVLSSTVSHPLCLLQSLTACLFTQRQTLYASYCTVLPNVSRYCTIRLKKFFAFLMFYLCEKYYKTITVQYCISHCAGWVPRLTLLDLQTNWTCKCALKMELIDM